MTDTLRDAPASAELEGLLRAAKDAATDDMVARLMETTSQTLDLLDRVNRSQVADALPAIAEMVRTGDLARLTRYARVLGAMEDAVTDDMVGRFAALAADATVMVDRLATGGAARLVELLGRMDATGALERVARKLPALVDNLERVEKMLECLAEASKEVQDRPQPEGGLLALLAMMRDPENQKALQFFMAAGRRMRAAGAKA